MVELFTEEEKEFIEETVAGLEDKELKELITRTIGKGLVSE